MDPQSEAERAVLLVLIAQVELLTHREGPLREAAVSMEERLRADLALLEQAPPPSGDQAGH